jgi:arginyl-tRNA synthetase
MLLWGLTITGDKEALDLWRLFRDLSWKEFEKIYERLGIKFDVISGESKFSERMQQEIARIKEKGLLTESKGAMVVELKVGSFLLLTVLTSIVRITTLELRLSQRRMALLFTLPEI